MLRNVFRLLSALLSAADAFCNRLYGKRFNPLYQSGTIVVTLYVVLVATGLWLVVFYRVGAPWESVAALTANPWIGNWVRGLHRYSSDLAVVATAVHALRMFAQARSTGARTQAWASGCVLLLLLFVCGWTGYVMVWDSFGQLLAREGSRMIDVLPVLSEPTTRAFTGEQPVATVFFFLNLFAHIGVPLVMGGVFWMHVKRLQRPLLLPPRPLMWTVIGAATAAAVLRPIVMAPRADAFTLPPTVPADLFFAFWLPLSHRLSAGHALLAATAFGIGFLILPRVTRPRVAAAPSVVDEDLCVGCVQCAIDCPYGAITMVRRADDRADLVARVDSHLCVSCGICAGSCAPMGVGPPGRSGRDQLERVRTFVSSGVAAGRIVVVGCEHAGAGADGRAGTRIVSYPVDCGGNLHTSVVELLLRGGAAGVMIVACPPRDCRHREGPRWLEERLYKGREAELQPRVDRARVRYATAGPGDRHQLAAAIDEFAAQIRSLNPAQASASLDVEAECEPAIIEDTA
jgi:coenzyme F420-reducing hydrogenase delta subunit/NAD-dependent dihydropyrimidine dehydrogenase PreA subunit